MGSSNKTVVFTFDGVVTWLRLEDVAPPAAHLGELTASIRVALVGGNTNICTFSSLFSPVFLMNRYKFAKRHNLFQDCNNKPRIAECQRTFHAKLHVRCYDLFATVGKPSLFHVFQIHRHTIFTYCHCN